MHPVSLLQPLLVPNQPWIDIAMGFIKGLLVSHEFSIIFFVVDRLTKHSHSFTFAHPYTTVKLVDVFFTEMFKFYGMPKLIVSDNRSNIYKFILKGTF